MADDSRVSRIYSNFRGVDFRGEEINLSRSPDSLNVWKDYKETESIRTRPEMALLHSFNKPIYGIFYSEYDFNKIRWEMFFVHSGSSLYNFGKKYRYNDSTKSWYLAEEKAITELLTNLVEKKSFGFSCNNNWYFLNESKYLMYSFTNDEIKEVVGYVPTTTIGRKPSGGGTLFEDVNMLSTRRINTFVGDGKSTEYHLDAQWISADDIEIYVNGEPVKNYVGPNGPVRYYTVDADKGIVTFTSAPSAPLTDGQDNVSIEFTANHGNTRKIPGCRVLEVFDNRVFFGGNPNYPNTIWHSSLNNPAYVSDLDYYNDGLDIAKVKGMVAGNNALWVFKEPSPANTSVFYHTPTIDSEYGKIYPSEHSSIALGCVGGAINFNDDIVFFSDNGMEGMSGDVTSEQAVAHRSSLVDRKLMAEQKYEDMILVEWEGYLIVFIGNKAYLADSRATFANNNHYEYEWFYWKFDKNITSATVIDGVLYLGAEDGLYTLTDFESDVESYWVTPKDRFKYPQYQKTTNKRGCVVEATGDISVYAKTDKTDFELIGNYENITDYFVSRIKRKKFKDIQLKFHSKTRFSLETATLECFIGGYIKR